MILKDQIKANSIVQVNYTQNQNASNASTNLSLTALPELNLNPNQFNLISMTTLGNQNLTTVLNTKNDNPSALTF